MTIKKRTLGSLISFINQSKTEYCPEITIGSRGARPSSLLIPQVPIREPRPWGVPWDHHNQSKLYFFLLISATSLLNTHLHYYLTYTSISSRTPPEYNIYYSRVPAQYSKRWDVHLCVYNCIYTYIIIINYVGTIYIIIIGIDWTQTDNVKAYTTLVLCPQECSRIIFNFLYLTWIPVRDFVN